ncbi:uncharacterized protein LOC128424374 isoform X1 [Podarcis raffonei]|uniref:uncharacterized protein LOC128424374 isoform X1 n=1 Tax=Podarcis raffonei TaxID=65483 RepID=UPI0023292E8D|nr:uncharacterized protein LOC128424374 isoform X1 [Podarcis raffonei]
MCFLASNLVLESSFNPLDISHLLQEFIKQFSGKAVEVEVLLEAFYKFTQGPTVEGRNMAVFTFSILSHHHLVKVVEYLLQFPFGGCQRIWKEVLASANPEQLIHLMAEQLYQSPLAESANQVVRTNHLLSGFLLPRVISRGFRILHKSRESDLHLSLFQEHLTSLLHTIFRMEEYKAAVRRNFPQLLIALLGMVVNFHYDQEFLG